MKPVKRKRENEHTPSVSLFSIHVRTMNISHGRPTDLVVNKDRLFVTISEQHDILVFNTRTKQLDSKISHTKLQYPRGMCFSDNKLYVISSHKNEVFVFREDGHCLLSFGSFGSKPGQLSQPANVQVSNGEVFVLERSAHRVSVFSCQGELIRTFRGVDPKGHPFSYPQGLAVDHKEVFVGNMWEHSIHVFSRDGKFLRRIGTEGCGPGQFRTPSSFLLFKDQLVVADYQNKRIQVLRRTDGAVFKIWKTQDHPQGLALSSDGEFFFVNHFGSCIQVCSPSPARTLLAGLHPRAGQHSLLRFLDTHSPLFDRQVLRIVLGACAPKPPSVKS